MSREGILLIDKPAGRTSFSLVAQLRRLSKIKKIGHAGTLDPFATGVLVLLIGKTYTRLSDTFLTSDKTYRATIQLGASTDSYDCTGTILDQSDCIPSKEELEGVLSTYQGSILQTPPMFSAKKVNGKKLYELARKGIEIERAQAQVDVQTKLLDYTYPNVTIEVTCSKGTYIRSLAHDIGNDLGCFGHLSQLTRTRSGTFSLEECVDAPTLDNPDFDYTTYLRTC